MTPARGLLALSAAILLGLAIGAPARRRCMSLTVPAQQVARVIDGDTYTLYDLGLTNERHVRVLGVDAVELKTPRGPEARDSTASWLHRGAFQISACRDDSFGRMLAWTVRDGDSLHVRLVEWGLGVRR
ncbi:MAG TPA: hypothetical protein VGE98_11185 [Thermoanaerobaculia bacterium]